MATLTLLLATIVSLLSTVRAMPVTPHTMDSRLAKRQQYSPTGGLSRSARTGIGAGLAVVFAILLGWYCYMAYARRYRDGTLPKIMQSKAYQEREASMAIELRAANRRPTEREEVDAPPPYSGPAPAYSETAAEHVRVPEEAYRGAPTRVSDDMRRPRQDGAV